MAITYTEAKATIDTISERLDQVRRRIDRARAQLVQADSEINAMQSEYSEFVTELDTTAAAEGTDIWLFAQAEKDALVVDFNALKTRATDLIAAYDSV